MAYPSVYPTSLDSYTTKTDGVDDVMAVDVNELQSAIAAIEAKLGIGALTAGRLPFVSAAGGITDSANATLDASGNAKFLGNVKVGTATATARLNVSATAFLISAFDSTNELGGYISLTNSGVDKFYIGDCRTVGGSTGFYDLYAIAGLGIRFFTHATLGMTLSAAQGLTVVGAFGCNAAAAQAAYAVGNAATDLPTVVALANLLRTALLNNGIAKVS